MSKDYGTLPKSSTSWNVYIPKQTVLNDEKDWIPSRKSSRRQHDVSGTGLSNALGTSNRRSQTLDLFTGKRLQQKIETPAFFQMYESKAVEPIGNTGKNSQVLDVASLDRNRFTPAIKYKDDVLEKENVGPGLNIKQNVPAADGFHSKYRFVDDMRDRNYHGFQSSIEQLPIQDYTNIKLSPFSLDAKEPALVTKIRDNTFSMTQNLDLSFPSKQQITQNPVPGVIKPCTQNENNRVNIDVPEFSVQSFYSKTNDDNKKGNYFKDTSLENDSTVTFHPFVKYNTASDRINTNDNDERDVTSLPGKRNTISLMNSEPFVTQTKRQNLNFNDPQDIQLQRKETFETCSITEQRGIRDTFSFPTSYNRILNKNTTDLPDPNYTSKQKDSFSDVMNSNVHNRVQNFDPSQFGSFQNYHHRSLNNVTINERNQLNRHMDPSDLLPIDTSKQDKQLFLPTHNFVTNNNTYVPKETDQTYSDPKKKTQVSFPSNSSNRIVNQTYNFDIGVLSTIKRSVLGIFDFFVGAHGRKEQIESLPSNDTLYNFSKLRKSDKDTDAYSVRNFKSETPVFSNNSFKEIVQQNNKRGNKLFDINESNRVSTGFKPETDNNIAAFMTNVQKNSKKEVVSYYPGALMNTPLTLDNDLTIKKTKKTDTETSYGYQQPQNMSDISRNEFSNFRTNERITLPTLMYPKSVQRIE
jgi:hypothetical protein